MTAQQLPFDDDRASQSQRILDFMLAGNRIDPMTALNLFGCFRLGGRIYDLKKLGHPVQSELVSRNGKKFSEYWIERAP